MGKVLLFLLSVSVESAFYLWGAFVGGRYLNERYSDLGVNWKRWLLLPVFVKIIHSFYLAIRLASQYERDKK
jgi:hypothetical protein